MAATVSASINNKGLFIGSVVTTVGTNGDLYVDNLREVTVAVRRTAGSTDTFSVQGSEDGTNFFALTSQTQVATGGDTALTGITTVQIHTLRQKVRVVRLVSSGTTDPGEMIVTAATRN